MLPHRRFAAALTLLCALFPFSARAQQAPIALPNTVSTLGGGTTTAFTVGAPCSAGSAFTATDTLGDGCPAASAYFGTTAAGDLRGGVGNLYVSDAGVSAIYKINAAGSRRR